MEQGARKNVKKEQGERAKITREQGAGTPPLGVSGWVRHLYRVGPPPLSQDFIVQLLWNLQTSMTHQNSLEFCKHLIFPTVYLIYVCPK